MGGGGNVPGKPDRAIIPSASAAHLFIPGDIFVAFIFVSYEEKMKKKVNCGKVILWLLFDDFESRLIWSFFIEHD